MPDLALQTLVRSRLINDADLTALVPASAIRDNAGRPELDRCILIGESQTVYQRFHARSYVTLHIWNKEPGLAVVKAIGSAVVQAVSFDGQIDGGTLSAGDYTCFDISVDESRYMLDPKAAYAHGVITLSAVMKEADL